MNNSSEYEYDERQLKLMKESLMLFEKKQICLDELAGSLSSALDMLESVEEGWKSVFWEEFDPLFLINEMECSKRLLYI